MNRSILSILALTVAVSVSACNKNTNNPRTKPVPGPTLNEEKKPKRHLDEDEGPVREKPKKNDVVDPTPAEKTNIPPPPTRNNPEYAGKADGKPGYVQSPYDPQHRLIDVRGLPPGTEAECPYTRRTFLVPP
jgi:hypothetical protein